MSISNIGKGAIISYVAIFINIAISFFYTPWMLSQIGVSDYGLYTLILSFLSYFILDFGLGSAVSRFVTKYRAEGDNQKVENVLGLILQVFIIIDICIFLALCISYLFIKDIFQGLTADELSKLKVLFVIAGTLSVLTFSLKPFEGILTAYEMFVPAKLIEMSYKIGSVGFVVIALYAGGNIYWIVFLNGFIAFITSLFRYLYWHKKTRLTPNLRHRDKNELHSIFAFSGWSFLIGVAQRFRLNMMPSVLGALSNSTQIAIFSLGMTIEAMIWTLSSALNGLFLPMVSRMVYEKDEDSMLELMIRVGRIQLYVIFLIFSSFIIFGKAFVTLWIGNELSDVYYIVLFLLSTYIFTTTMQIANDKVLAENKIKLTARITFITSLGGIAIAILTAKEFGAIGCAISTFISQFVMAFFNMRIYQKDLNLNVMSFLQECHLKIIPIPILFACCSYAVVLCVDTFSWMKLLCYCSIYVFVYSVICYKWIFNRYEKDLLMSIIKSLKI